MELPVEPARSLKKFVPIEQDSKNYQTARRLEAAGCKIQELRQRVLAQSLDAAHTASSVLAAVDPATAPRSVKEAESQAWREARLQAAEAQRALEECRHSLPSSIGGGELLRVAQGLTAAIDHLLLAGQASVQTQTILQVGLAELIHKLRATLAELASAKKQAEERDTIETAVAQLHTKILKGEPISLEELEAVSLSLVLAIEAGSIPVASYASSRPRGDWLVAQSLDAASIVAFLSGQDERWRPYRLHLVAAALVQNAGMRQLPAKDWDIEGPLAEATQTAVERHPLIASIALESVMGFPPEFAGAVAKHHERLDGSGYPARLAGSAIDASARLLAIAEVYAALRADRPHRQAFSPQRALTEILRMADTGGLDQAWARGLLNLSFYPAGTLVELSTGEKGEVVAAQEARTEPYLASLPVVRLLADESGKPLTAPVYRNLAQRPECRIIRQISQIP